MANDTSKVDVLTNSLAAIMLLLTIAVTMMGKKSGAPRKPSKLQNATVTIGLAPESKEKKVPNYNVFVGEFQFHGQGQVRLATETTDKDAIDLYQGLYDPTRWHVRRTDSLANGSWAVRMHTEKGTVDSVSVRLSLGLHVIFHRKIKAKNGLLLRIQEPIKQQSDIELFENQIITYNE